MVAFQFQFANQSGWKCDKCRKDGLEQRRNCGFVQLRAATNTVVWARRQVGIFECPVSFITAASEDWQEQFHLWKMAGKPNLLEFPARTAEAIALLENEWREELNETTK